MTSDAPPAGRPARLVYPELPDVLTPEDLHRLFSPSHDERQWARTVARALPSQVGLLVQLKIFQTIGRFRRAPDIPAIVFEHVARRLGAQTGPAFVHSDRTLYRSPSGSISPPRAFDVKSPVLAAASRQISGCRRHCMIALPEVVAVGRQRDF
jgi:hypothetical protein